MNIIRAVRDYPAQLRYRRELRGRNFNAIADHPVLAFGASAPRQGELVHGGRVKLTHLEKRFAHDEARFNLLYLVSSAIPPFAEELVVFALRNGARFVWNQNGVGFPAWAGRNSAVVNKEMSRLARLADFIIYQSDFCKQSAEKYLLVSETKPSAILLNPVDLETFAPSSNPPPFSRVRLLTAGTHNQAERVTLPVEALSILRKRGLEAQLTIAGELRWKNAQTELRDLLEQRSLARYVEIKPSFSQEEAAKMLREHHVLLHMKYHDPCPTMVIEALASGIPVIGSVSGGMPQLVGDDGGKLLQTALSWEKPAYPDPGLIADAIASITHDWPAHSHLARARAERLFSAEKWLASHGAIFQSLLAAR